MEENKSIGSDAQRRKRINRYKKIIIIACVVLIMIPILLCIILFIRVCSLQKQVDNLLTLRDSGVIVAMASASGEVKYQYVEKNANSANDEDSEDLELINSENDNPSGSVADEKAEVSDNNSTAEDGTEPIDISSFPKFDGTGKKVYLTFDDGPSINTEKIINILDKYKVKATFFVNGRDDAESISRYKLIVDTGNVIASHSYTHQYKDIYASVDNFDADLTKLRELIYNSTGYNLRYFRFPGGSSTTTMKVSVYSLIDYLNNNDYLYFDWNVSSSDASKGGLTKEEIITNVLSGIETHDVSIVLMHDAKSKQTTVEALPVIIELLQEYGCELLPISDNTKLVQQRKSA